MSFGKRNIRGAELNRLLHEPNFRMGDKPDAIHFWTLQRLWGLKQKPG